MRATFILAGEGIRRGTVSARTIDVAPTLAFLAGIPAPGQSQGRVLLDVLRDRGAWTPISLIGLNDFHGQLDPTTMAFDGINTPVGGAAQLATMFDEEAATLPGPTYLLAAGDNVGASPANSGLLADMPAIDVENAWGLDATSYGNHEFDYGIARLQAQQARANFPFLAVNIVETATGRRPSWVTAVEGLHDQRDPGRRHRRRAARHAGARFGRRRPPDSRSSRKRSGSRPNPSGSAAPAFGCRSS